MGMESPKLCCTIICNSHGPLLSVDPAMLDWGKIPLLEEATKELTLTNLTSVPAKFSAVIVS